MPTEMELTLEQTQQGVSYEVSIYYNNSGQSNTNNATNNDIKADQSKSVPDTLTNDQYQRLMALLSDTSNTSKTHASIADFLYDIIDVTGLNLTISHSNGTVEHVKYIGSYKLANDLIIKDVLVVLGYHDLTQRFLIGTSSEKGGLYFLDEGKKVNNSNIKSCQVSTNIWHNRLGHPSDQVLTVLKNKLKDLNHIKPDPCEVCHKAKQTREPFPLSVHKTKRLGDLVHLDVWGPYRVRSREGFKYFLTVVDDFTRALWVFLMQSKTKVFDNILEFYNLVKNQFNTSVKIFRSDNGGLPLNMWHESVLTATYLINRSNDPYDDGGDSADNGNKSAPKGSVNSPNGSTVGDAAKDQSHVQIENTNTIDLSVSSPSRKVTQDIQYATKTEVLEEEDVYMSIPEGYYDQGDKGVCNDKDVMLILLVYVDDIILTENNVDEINKFKQFLGSKFLIKDLGKLKYFLGIKVLDIDNGICLTQRKYCTELLNEFGMLACKPCSTPIEVNPDDKKVVAKYGDDVPLTGITNYQKLVGKLIYLTMTRPDISYAVHCQSQVMYKPMQCHLRLAFRVLRYLKKEPGLGIIFRKSDNSDLRGFVDSDWAKCKITKRSITGYSVFLGDNLVSWKSKKQVVMSRSSTVAEYKAMCNVCCEVM
ncbi:ribonuclease H-like domain-containing protein [Tanacetum coccineum]